MKQIFGTVNLKLKVFVLGVSMNKIIKIVIQSKKLVHSIEGNLPQNPV